MSKKEPSRKGRIPRAHADGCGFAKGGSLASKLVHPPSPSPCPADDRCGGCQNIAVPYAEQLAAKDTRIAKLFPQAAAAGLIGPIKGMDNPFRYRNKVMSPFAPGKKIARAGSGKGARGRGDDRRGPASHGRSKLDREILTGMYEPHSHRLVPAPAGGCLIENEEAARIVATVRDLMARFGVPPYKESTGAGFLRHAVVRVGHESGEILLTLVTNGTEFPNAKAFCREIVRRHSRVATVVQNVNTRDTNVVLGSAERTLYGPGFILDTLCGLTFRISSQSFYQVNSAQTEILYRIAIELARFSGIECAIDAYCGTGTIGLVAAGNGAARVVGVDSVASAVRDARQNARHNGVENAEFVCADAGDFLRGLAGVEDAACDADAFGVRGTHGLGAKGAREPLVLLMDPPRAGSSKEFLDAAAHLRPQRIVYISCNPETQARDVAFLSKRGYRIDAVQPVDMFPHTDHIENVVALECD